jgi:hypothetical protein
MEPAKQTNVAGGCLLALSIMVGAVAGVLYEQATLGLLAGLAAGLALLTLVWLLNRR